MEDPSSVMQVEMPTPPVSDEIWKLILDRSKIPEIMSHIFSGEVWVVEEKEKDGQMQSIGRWEKLGDPLMNKIGVRFFMSLMFSAMSPDKIVTFLTEDEVARMAKDMTKTVIYIIAERGDEFEMAASNRRYVVELFDQFYFANLTASRKGTILNALKPMYERKEIYSPQQKQGFKFPSLI